MYRRTSCSVRLSKNSSDVCAPATAGLNKQHEQQHTKHALHPQSVSCKRNALLQKPERSGSGPIEGRPISSRMRFACTFTHRLTCQLTPERRDTIAVAEHCVCPRARRSFSRAAPAAEAQGLVPRCRLDAAVAVAFAGEPVRAADVPSVRHERRQIAVLDALPAALVGQSDVLGLKDTRPGCHRASSPVRCRRPRTHTSES